ncbi:hypothetical protein CP973_00225 [Streptomyces albofaciens JCM 4342]|uniref:hypothetical protein n=1 Tax=Streptomyces albofaciens TaxID=66866 RepID=UPI001239DCDD|nr:hypothetical protein [Streptomyces albofaciens]KAA6215130.1 hypothetical protein CP973_39810 [Streptomyces albofaciens JCM 4342]KAA6220629.1 hypothetical protein CP973_00225 [Streptomyces albofaciens JCM 4342]
MSRRRADRKQRTAERTARRDSLLVLLSRVQRHGTLTPAEAALLRAHVEAEITEADRYRAEAGGQQAAVRREQQRLAAAEAAIVEAEAEAARHAADHAAACQQIAAMHAAAVGEVRGPRRGIVEDVADIRQRALDAEEQLAAYRAVYGHGTHEHQH